MPKTLHNRIFLCQILECLMCVTQRTSVGVGMGKAGGVGHKEAASDWSGLKDSFSYWHTSELG
jgi:hypothetical protein